MKSNKEIVVCEHREEVLFSYLISTCEKTEAMSTDSYNFIYCSHRGSDVTYRW